MIAYFLLPTKTASKHYSPTRDIVQTYYAMYKSRAECINKNQIGQNLKKNYCKH